LSGLLFQASEKFCEARAVRPTPVKKRIAPATPIHFLKTAFGAKFMQTLSECEKQKDCHSKIVLDSQEKNTFNDESDTKLHKNWATSRPSRK
jgi:hypothetical protein